MSRGGCAGCDTMPGSGEATTHRPRAKPTWASSYCMPPRLCAGASGGARRGNPRRRPVPLGSRPWLQQGLLE
eukprot:13456211-Alexandrium_andersonii.AAC.1